MSDFYQQIVESLPSGVVTVDRAGRILSANGVAKAILANGHPVAEGLRLADLAGSEELISIFEEMREDKLPRSRIELTLTNGRGEKQDLGLSASLLRGPDLFNGVIFLFTDMTERRRLERAAELNRQLAALGELTAGVVHELRTPVTIISGMAELLMRKIAKEDERHKTSEAIYREAVALEKSISQFLGLARPFDLTPEDCTAESIVQRAVQLCRRRAEVKGVLLRVHANGEPPGLVADKERLAQALVNLLNNAIDASQAGDHIDITTDVEGDWLLLAVADAGPGIHLGQGEDVFTPFFTKKEGGTGLGLTLVHRIVSAHRGSVIYRNLSPKGVAFEIRIPISAIGELL
ncbi:MAG: hypothetical protein AMXMBFR84_21530 [Candidatus Hydrogenedentota bacterium]